MKMENGKNYEVERTNVNIPDGFHYVTGTIDTGYIIENEIGDRYVLVPEGTNADGMHIRDFWVSCFEISKGEDDMPRSIAGEFPWVNITLEEAKKAAEKVNGFVISGEEYNRICMWMALTGAASVRNIFGEGGELGFYEPTFDLVKTGSNPNWECNGIFDFWGGCYIWTTEPSELASANNVIRGGHSHHLHKPNYPPTNRAWATPEERRNNLTFRIVLRCKIGEDEED